MVTAVIPNTTFSGRILKLEQYGNNMTQKIKRDHIKPSDTCAPRDHNIRQSTEPWEQDLQYLLTSDYCWAHHQCKFTSLISDTIWEPVCGHQQGCSMSRKVLPQQYKWRPLDSVTTDSSHMSFVFSWFILNCETITCYSVAIIGLNLDLYTWLF